MRIKNNSSKIINIGTTALLPESSMPASKALIETPAIKALIKRGSLSVTEEKKAKGEQKADGATKGKKGENPSDSASAKQPEGTEETGDKQ